MSDRPEFSVNLTLADDDPREWARRREDQGWDCLAITDHLSTDYRPPFPHLWVSAGAVATATSTVRIETTFVNGVFRHPADTAQAARQLQQVSDGRFELGVGAGWYADEMTTIGITWPEPGDRAGAFAEAVQVIRPLLRGGGCSFHGRYYDVELPPVGPSAVAAPALIASVGGRRTIREVTPHVDRVELKPAAVATRGGSLNWDRYALVTDDDVAALLALVRDVRPDIEIDLFVLCNASTDSATRERHDQLGGSFGARFFGDPVMVSESLTALGELGVRRVQLSAVDPASLDLLAPVLIG